MRPQIIIIGAGMAGIAAANSLAQDGFSVKILEARNRIGGRIWLDHYLGFPVSRGAGWIHGIDNNPLMDLAKKYSAVTFQMDMSRRIYFDRNYQPIPLQVVEHFHQKIMNPALEMVGAESTNPVPDISLAQALTKIIDYKKLSPLEQDLYLYKLKFFENYIGAEYQLLSASHWDEEQDDTGPHVIVADGYEKILTGLIKNCHVELNTRVQIIKSSLSQVEIVTNRGVFNADAVIVTLPLGVLKKRAVVFDPPLSTEKTAAIDRLGMGLFNIAGMLFPTRFWPDSENAFFMPAVNNYGIFFNFGRFLNKPFLLGYIGGKSAHLTEMQADSQIISQIMQQFKIVFGEQIPHPEKYFLTRWGKDPYSLGSYSFLPVGASGLDRDVLAKPEFNRYFFAGEATSRQFPATTHGAYLSGLREAEKIKQKYK